MDDDVTASWMAAEIEIRHETALRDRRRVGPAAPSA